MLRLTSRITIGEFQFNNCVDVKIKSSWNELTDTCTLTIPRKVKWTQQDLVAGDQPALALGDAVTIELGYNFQYSTYFQGVVTAISAQTPVEIECQDVMWLMKQVTHNKAYGKNTKLNTIIADLQSTYNKSDIYKKYKIPVEFIPYGNIETATTTDDGKQTQIGELRCNNVTIAFILDTLKGKLGLPSFAREGKIYTGLAYYANQRSDVERIFNYNIISDSLEYKRSEDTKIKLVVKNNDKDRNIATVEVGDADGATRTLFVSGLSESEMRKVGLKELEKYKYTGWFGSFETFGDVFIKHGDVVNIIDNVITDRNGKYYVKSVETTFGVNGFRNNVELDKKAL